MCILATILKFRLNIVIFFGCCPVKKMISAFASPKKQNDPVNARNLKGESGLLLTPVLTL